MNEIHASCFFSEDIRHETTGCSSLIGVFGGVVDVAEFPVTFPKFGIFSRIYVPKVITIQKVSIKIVSNKSPELVMGLDMPDDDLQKLLATPPAEDSFGYSFDLNGVASLMTVEAPCRWEFFARINDEEVWGGGIRFVQQDTQKT